MREAWELLTSGPEDADRSVLLLPDEVPNQMAPGIATVLSAARA